MKLPSVKNAPGLVSVIALVISLCFVGQTRPHVIRDSGNPTLASASDTRPDREDTTVAPKVDNSTSGAESENPFLRLRRDASSGSPSCPIPANLPDQVAQLNSFLTDSQYVGLIPQQDGFIPLPSDQPHNSCPAATGSWWPRPEVNLRSTCPWVYQELDNGEDAYPRHLLEAKCMCTKCVGATAYSCKEIRHDVTIFRMQGCKDGVALMTKDVVTITLGCFCAAPEPNDHHSDSSDDNYPLTD